VVIMHMYPTIQETGSVGKVQIGQKTAAQEVRPAAHMMQPQPQQPQLVQQLQQQMQQVQQQQQIIQQMRQQMMELQAELTAQRQPKAKTYTMGQVQILIACETINNVMEEFELSPMKKERLNMARDYLLRLSDLGEFVQSPQQPPQSDESQEQPLNDQQTEPFPEGGDPLYEEQPTGESVPGAGNDPVMYQGKPDETTISEIDKINQKMAELKQDNIKVEKAEKAKTGLEKIKDFIMKKSTVQQEEPKPDRDYSNIPEGMG
jgi:hypothetical protein